jgi:hypothetical protein
VIPEIDIWRVANLMLTHFGDTAVAESANEPTNSRLTVTSREWRFGYA